MRPLEELSYAELMELFPIALVPHRDEWREQYARERERLLAQLPEDAVFRLSHVGSTAIDGIWAKPTVDMLLEATGAAAFERLDAAIPACGYIRMRSEEGRVSFNRGYTPKGFAQEVFHLHLRLPGDADEVFFRDYLALRPDLAAEYERLKLALCKPYERDRDGYTAAKGDFVRRVTAEARQYFATEK